MRKSLHAQMMLAALASLAGPGQMVFDPHIPERTARSERRAEERKAAAAAKRARKAAKRAAQADRSQP